MPGRGFLFLGSQEISRQFLGRGLVGLGVEETVETGVRVGVERPRGTSRGQDFTGGLGASPGAGAEEAGARTRDLARSARNSDRSRRKREWSWVPGVKAVRIQLP